MDWIQAVIYTTSEGIEPISGRLYTLGITGIEIEDEQDFNEFLDNYRDYWNYVDDALREKMSGEPKVKVYLPASPEGNEMLAQIRESLTALKELDTEKAFGRLELSLANLSEEDWANNWKQYYKPIKVGKRIWIKPEWETLPEDTEGRTIFTIDPGMTFGTGGHESTRLCLEAIERHCKQGSTVLDLGCGSGILSIVSLLLGAREASAVDIDPVAQKVAYENAALNNIYEDRYHVYTGNVLSDNGLRARLYCQKYDLVLANIVADVIIALAPDVPGLLHEDSVFICSGIIDERRDEVAAVLRSHGLEIKETHDEKGWSALVCVSKA